MLRWLALLCFTLCAVQLRAQSYAFSSTTSLSAPTGIAVDSSGNRYATLFYNHTVVKIAPDGNVTTLAGSYGNAGFSDGTGPVARFRNPRGLGLDRSGNLYVADSGNHIIRKITPEGVVTTLAGRSTVKGHADGSASEAEFDDPQGIAVDAAGNVFVADTGTRTIRRVTPAGVVSTVAGLAYVTDAVDATGLAARFNVPQGVAVDGTGTLYVADTGNHSIRKITSGGVVTTFAGSNTNRGYTDGNSLNARFDSPQALTVDSAGNVFVVDSNNFTIRKITPAGVVTTIAGLVGLSGSSSGVGSNARFYQPRGIALDTGGSLHVGDSFGIRLGTTSNQLAITVQPETQAVAGGSTARLSVTATGQAPITYQWQKDGALIPDATNSTLSLVSVQPSDTANYTVTITNPTQTLSSQPATITILSPLANDNFANAQGLTAASGEVSGRTNGATGELSEPTHSSPASTASSVWYRWTAPTSGTVAFEASGSYPVVAVYTGSTLSTLQRVASGTRATFTVTAGTTYHVAVGSFQNASRGTFTLTWRTIPNDAFALAQEISGAFGQVTGNNYAATAEPGEPNHLPGSSATTTSVWYRWTAPETGTLLLDSLSAGPSVVAALYTGSAINALTSVDYATLGFNTGTFAVNVTAGTTYSIAVGSYGYSQGSFTLGWRMTQLPIIVAQPSSTTIRAGTPLTLTVRAISPFGIVYQWRKDGVAIAGATAATYAIPSTTPSDAGTYTVTVRNNFGTAGSNPFVVAVVLPPPNDNFADARAIPALNGSSIATNVNATGEPNEPVHWNASGTSSSVWFRWTPSTGGLAVIDTVGSQIDTVLAVYTGTALSSLTRIAQDDDRGGGRTSQVTFAATGGTEYFIAVGSSSSGGRGAITLGWQLSPTLAIAAAPVSQTITAGGSATFAVQATGSGITYQWRRNGEIIPGATNATLTVGSVPLGSDASYTVTITNSSGSVTSAPATLSVAVPPITTLARRNFRAGADLLWSIAGNGNNLVSVGSAGVILSSSDNGASWTPRYSGTTGWLVAVTYGNGQFVIVGEAGTILTSPDGVTWTRVLAAGTTERLNNVLFADGKYVAVGEKGTVVTSTDGRIWTLRTTPVKTWLHGLAYHAGIRHFAASGEAGVFLTSPDAVNWTQLPIPGVSFELHHTVGVDSYAHFVTAGDQGKVISVRRNELVLKDGSAVVTWSAEAHATNTTSTLYGLTQGAGALFATSIDGKVITATSDRGPWSSVATGTAEHLLAGMYHNNTLFIVGQQEVVFQSEPMYLSRLANISTRGQVGTEADVMISGFVISGDRPKQVLVRAAGPTLASSFGLTDALAAPVLRVVDSTGRTVATNAGWDRGTSSNDVVLAGQIRTAAQRVGAFPFAANSADSALLLTLSPGAYTAVISGTNNTTGLSLVEVYDTDALSNEGSRAINISTRGVAGADAKKLIAGFVIEGAAARRVLIRAVGPSLGAAPFNVPGTLGEPTLEIYNSRGLLHATGGTWGLQNNADEIRGAARSVSAFPLLDGSKDAAMVVTLPPGAWTVQVGGNGDTTGVVLVEVYALP